MGWPVTWFVRADPQLRDYYGSSAFLLERYKAFWKDAKAAGDEVAWHPHITRVNEGGRHEPERDDERFAAALRVTHAELTTLGYRFNSVRLGEAFGGNICIRALAELGLRVDSSAIPGRRRDDLSRAFNWLGSPNEPYWPSVSDYRISGTPALPILEVPMTVVPVHAPFDPKPLPRYANLAYCPTFFSAAIERWLRLERPPRDSILTLILHPDELVPGSREHPLYAFTPDAVSANIQVVVDLIRRRNIDLVGLTMSGIEELICQGRFH